MCFFQQLGGPSWTVLLGRRDSTTASQSAANSNIPAPTLNLSQLITTFSNKGFTTQELVALSGSYFIYLFIYLLLIGIWVG